MAANRPDPVRQARQFAWALLVIGMALAGLSLWRAHPTRAAVVAGAALLPPLLAYAARPLWMAFFRQWMRFAEVLSWVMTRVVLTVFFFLILTPYSLLLRLLRKAPLDLAWKDGRATFWIDKAPVEPDLERYRKAY
jgi:uncharacterized membrane protein